MTKSAFHYADFVIASTSEFTGAVPAADDAVADITYRCGHTPAPVRGRLISRSPAEDLWLRVFASGSSLHFVFEGVASFTTNRSSGEIVGYPETGVEPLTMEHLLMDQVLPLYMVNGGRQGLHASAISASAPKPSLAWVFMGRSGAGKSTTAFGCARAGARLLADDFVLMSGGSGPSSVVPIDRGVRLWPDSVAALGSALEAKSYSQHTPKERVFLTPDSDRGRTAEIVRPGALVFLEPRSMAAAPLRLEPVPHAEAMMLVLEHSFRLDPTNVQERLGLLERSASLVEQVPAVRVSMPDDLEDLVPRCRELLDLLEARFGSQSIPG